MALECGVWGDSIAYGSCDPEALGWVGRLRKQLAVDDEYCVYNFGICGDTSTGLLTRFSAEAMLVKPDMVIFAIGINDSKIQIGDEGSLVPLDQFCENMQLLIQHAKTFTNNIIIVGATPVDPWFETQSQTARFINTLIEEYNTALSIVAEKNSCVYIGVFHALDPSLDLADGLHPNASGYTKLAEKIAPYLLT